MQDNAGEVMFSYGSPNMARQKQGEQLEPTYSSFVRKRDGSDEL